MPCAAALDLSFVCIPTMHNVSPNRSARFTTVGSLVNVYDTSTQPSS